MPLPKISLLHASYGRPTKAIEAMCRALDRATSPDDVEYIIAAESEDTATIEAAEGVCDIVVSGAFKGSAPAWGAAAAAAHGELLIQMQDDVEPPQGWDALLWEKYDLAVNWHHLRWKGAPDAPLHPAVVIRVSDGHRSDGLMCTAIINRARYEQAGEFLHPGYQSVYSDGDFTYRALRDAKEGKCQVIDARGITFLHRHHYHYPKEVPMDATYARENSADAYASGLKLFESRNPGWRQSGLVDWI